MGSPTLMQLDLGIRDSHGESLETEVSETTGYASGWSVVSRPARQRGSKYEASAIESA